MAIDWSQVWETTGEGAQVIAAAYEETLDDDPAEVVYVKGDAKEELPAWVLPVAIIGGFGLLALVLRQ